MARAAEQEEPTPLGDKVQTALDEGRILILGRITPFLDIHSRVSCCQEHGLLSVAFHPHYRDNGFFFVDYTNLNGDTVITLSNYLMKQRDEKARELLRLDQELQVNKEQTEFCKRKLGQLTRGQAGVGRQLGDGRPG